MRNRHSFGEAILYPETANLPRNTRPLTARIASSSPLSHQKKATRPTLWSRALGVGLLEKEPRIGSSTVLQGRLDAWDVVRYNTQKPAQVRAHNIMCASDDLCAISYPYSCERKTRRSRDRVSCWATSNRQAAVGLSAHTSPQRPHGPHLLAG
jgi:hypothetical protein